MKPYQQHQGACRKSSWFAGVALSDSSREPVRLGSGDKLIFGIKRDPEDTAYTVRKVLTSADELGGVYTISLTPEDLNVTPDRYFYDIGVQTEDGSFIKIVPLSPFDICPNITEKEVT